MDTKSSLRAAIGCVAILSNILRLLRQLLCNFLAMTDKPDPSNNAELGITLPYADVMKLVDMQDLGSCAARRGG
ncbi:hypothetical protein [Rickettsia felis]|uniref:hypothetical protein n=1 Tax=Rickettsia felis TaxID=42862 RepID=UPI0015849FA2|nr:hypothetical protein [Rickettsia felis]